MKAGSVLRVAGGLVQGVPSVYNKNIVVFKGLPYAASTAGKNRWRPPQPVQPWEGVRQADTYGPVCPQVGPAGGPEQSEDCLSVNIWTPTAELDAPKLPVFVWIHGGRFTMDAGSNKAYDGTWLAAKGVVVVTLNYRLGILGWLATPELSAESGHNASGNYGLLDQQAALRWVQENIAAFGGDPKQVTIGGQSAGGASTGIHLLSPLARGLFQRVINESGFRYPRDPLLSGLSPAYRVKERAEQQGDMLLREKGASSVEELRSVDLAILLEGNNRSEEDVWGTPPLFRPCLDGYVFPYGFGESLERGAAADVPIMTGHNADEGGTYQDPAFGVDDLKACAEQKYGPLAGRFLELYPVTAETSPVDAWNEAARDNSRVTTAMWAEEFHKHASSNAYGYFFDHAPPDKQQDPPKTGSSSQSAPLPTRDAPLSVYTYMKNVPGMSRGAFHGAEVAYALNNLDAQEGYVWSDTDRAVAETVSTYWASFIKTGNPSPTAGDLPSFAPVSSETIMILGQNSRAMRLAVAPERVAFWREHLTRQNAF